VLKVERLKKSHYFACHWKLSEEWTEHSEWRNLIEFEFDLGYSILRDLSTPPSLPCGTCLFHRGGIAACCSASPIPPGSARDDHNFLVQASLRIYSLVLAPCHSLLVTRHFHRKIEVVENEIATPKFSKKNNSQ
jgi:hypothetical protein